MCELLGMSASTPTDIIFGLKTLAQRGGLESPHRDGWGIAFYSGSDIQLFRDATSIAESAIANLLQTHPIESETVIAHIRHANVGNVCLSNTHPFSRELWGQNWAFAHNGQLTEFRAGAGIYQAIGGTDSEAIFCDLLNRIRALHTGRIEFEIILPILLEACAFYKMQGPFNCLLSNGEWLFSFCSTKLASLTGPKKTASSTDKNKDDVVTVIATEPLSVDKNWDLFASGEWRLWQSGLLAASGRV